jgi:hypothetical protein
MDRREFPFSKARLFLVGLVGLCLPVTLWGAAHFASRGDWGDAIFLLIVSLPLALFDVWIWRRLLTNRPALILTSDALIDQSSIFAAGRVERTHISGIRVGRAAEWRGVVVEFHDRTRRYGKQSTTIVTFLLGRSPESLVYELQQWLAGSRQY